MTDFSVADHLDDRTQQQLLELAKRATIGEPVVSRLSQGGIIEGPISLVNVGSDRGCELLFPLSDSPSHAVAQMLDEDQE